MNIFSDSFGVRYDADLKSIVIEHPDQNQFLRPLIQIREETFSSMSLEELSGFIGFRLLLLMPTMREHFKEEIEKMTNSDFGPNSGIKRQILSKKKSQKKENKS